MSKEMRKILVTAPYSTISDQIVIVGADTYYGAHLALHLTKARKKVWGYGASKIAGINFFAWYNTDYLSWQELPGNAEWIIFCHDPQNGFDKHIAALRSLCEHLYKSGSQSKLCYLSSYRICHAARRGIKETASLESRCETDVTIVTAEQWLSAYTYLSENTLISYIFRLGMPYGDELGFVKRPGILNYYLQKAMNKQPLAIYGIGMLTRTLIHIQDACECIRLLINMDFLPRICNVPGEQLHFTHLLLEIGEHFGVEVEIKPALFNLGELSGVKMQLSAHEFNKMICYKPRYKFNEYLATLPHLKAIKPSGIKIAYRQVVGETESCIY